MNLPARRVRASHPDHGDDHPGDEFFAVAAELKVRLDDLGHFLGGRLRLRRLRLVWSAHYVSLFFGMSRPRSSLSCVVSTSYSAAISGRCARSAETETRLSG